MKLGELYKNLDYLDSPIRVISSRTCKVLLRRMLPQHLSVYGDVSVRATKLELYLVPDKTYAKPIAVCFVSEEEFREAKLEAEKND